MFQEKQYSKAKLKLKNNYKKKSADVLRKISYARIININERRKITSDT